MNHLCQLLSAGCTRLDHIRKPKTEQSFDMSIGFKPAPLNVPITLFRPETSIPGLKGKAVKVVLRGKAKTLGWHKVSNTIEVIDVNGDHHSMLNDEINTLLVNHLKFLLDQINMK